MSELLPTLRESLRHTSLQSAGTRWHPRPHRPLVPALIAVAMVAAALILTVQHDGAQPAAEVTATPTAAPTVVSTPVLVPSPSGTPRAMPKLDRNDLRATPVAPDTRA